MSLTLQRRWQIDFDQVAAKIPGEWLLVDQGGWVGVHPDHRDDEVVELYARLAQVGYARGWLS